MYYTFLGRRDNGMKKNKININISNKLYSKSKLFYVIMCEFAKWVLYFYS